MSPDTIENILSPTSIAAIRSSMAATCELLDPQTNVASPVSLTSPRDLPPTQVHLFKELLLDPGSWFFPQRRCLPRQTALFSLRWEQALVRVAISVPCAAWVVTGPDEPVGGFFDPVMTPVRELLKSTFPEFASPNRRSMWKAGAIAELRSQASATAGRPRDEPPGQPKASIA